MKKLLISLVVILFLSISFSEALVNTDFIFFDDFTTLNNSIWNTTDTSCTIISGALKCDANGEYARSQLLGEHVGFNTSEYFNITFTIVAEPVGDRGAITLQDDKPVDGLECAVASPRGDGCDTANDDRMGLYFYSPNEHEFLPRVTWNAGNEISSGDTVQIIHNFTGYFMFINNVLMHNASTTPTNKLNYIGVGDWESDTVGGITAIDDLEIWYMGTIPPPPPPVYTPEITINTNLIAYTNSTDNPYFFTVNVTAINVTYITNWTVNVYHNDTLNKSIFTSLNLNASSLTLNLTYGTDQVGYNINITINNTNGGAEVSDNIQRLDIFLDSVIPLGTLINIANNSILYYGIDTTQIVVLNVSDNNLYSANLSLKNSSGYVLNNTFVENINTTSYSINFSFNVDTLLNGSYEIWGQVWDDHNPLDNDEAVKPLPWYFSGNNLIADNDIMFQGNIKPNDTEGTPLTYFYLDENKYKLKITFENTATTHYLNLSASNKLTYRSLSGYFGHFVYFGENGGRFIDTMGPNIKNVVVTDLGNNKYSLAVELYAASDEIELESIGSLNTLLSIWSFSISHGFTFTARDSIANTSISNFTIEIWNGTTLLDNKTTTTTNLTFNLTSGSYHTNITNEDYVRNESNITYSPGGTHTFYLTAANSLYLFFYDEEDKSLVNTINVSIDVLGPSSATNYLTDTGSKFISGFDIGNYEIRYSGTGYRTRTYYTTIATSTTQRIDLYMIKNTTSSLIVFFIGDEKSNPIFNATLKAKRFMLTDNAYILISMERTDLNGETAMYLEPNDVFYSFIGEKDGAVIFTGTPQRIYSSNVYIRAPLQESEILGLSNIMLTTTTSLTYDNDTKLLSYTFNDATSLVLEGCLKVIKRTSLTETTIGPTCVTSNSATIIINLTSHLQNDTSYTAIGTVKTNTTNTVFPTDVLMDFIHVNTPWDRFGRAGLFVAYILILTMFFVGITVNFSIAMSYSILAMAVVQIIGLSFFGWSLIMIFIIIGFIVAVVNRI